jgi:hypothetical protein
MSQRTLELLCLVAAWLLVATPSDAQQPSCSAHALDPSSKVIPRLELESEPSLTALELVQQSFPTTFEVIGSALALRGRGALESGSVVEPLLLFDGVAMEGSIAQVMDGLKAGDLARIEVHLGVAATWRFRPSGAPAVIEIASIAGAPALLRPACRPL